jgi:hypothetical protein
MDVDTTEIQIWTRQPDGTHQMRWLLLRDLMKLMKETTPDAPTEPPSAPELPQIPSD